MLSRFPAPRIASYLLAALALFLVLHFHLIAPLLGGLLVFELVQLVSSRTHLNRLPDKRARLIALVLISCFIGLLLCLLGASIFWIFRGEANAMPDLLKRVETIHVTLRQDLPHWIANYLPQDLSGWKVLLNEWTAKHAANLQSIGKHTGHVMAQLLIAMVIGALISLHPRIESRGPLALALQDRCRQLSMAFRNIVFAQVRISALNTFFTWCYLGVLLPMWGIHLPLGKTLIVLTFFAGLLPVIGNLISNTAIFVTSLSISPAVAMASLTYLVVIHKLEYFLNARIVGSRISARAWEILLAMLALEAMFGLQGLVAAPVFYAYVKDELKTAGLV